MPRIGLGHEQHTVGKLIGDMQLLARCDDDRHMWMGLVHSGRQRGAVDRSGHRNIGEDGADFGVPIQGQQRLVGAVGLDHHITRILKRKLDMHQQKLLVFDD